MMLPLFPLDTVLFPGCFLDLQIFEARYLDMIGRCMKQGEGFGVVCIVEGEQVGKAPPVVASIGCEAVIRDFVQQDNGLLGIRVEGVRRFDLQATEVLKDQLLVGQVQWLPDLEDSPLQEADDDLLALLLALGEHPMVEALDMPRAVDGRQALANQLAYLLPFTEQDKLDLLAQDSPEQRLGEIHRLLERIQGELFA
ncbi:MULTISPECIES: LON peptidase substrate-binding domain-containing protein [Pseudomonas putida group]|uniref:LON peptidase substrate-binding domain-containing protein n=1 Tax=Pseudomonas putida group TaxID=136845 RepID=UPI0015F6AB02|nr:MULTISPECIES: LON peptidase substrate-binding domain-containing protein [Pseudomonas putida group]MBA5708770.1 ATP-dependent protease [Pseudomonas fulva]MBF8691557.1 LON peptidase substrate-binding domain-containing protein [Pseudomonas fulva]MBF8725754.1 LON peptidase substrate-binding domain-containing protein [Pseudomonas putida]